MTSVVTASQCSTVVLTLWCSHNANFDVASVSIDSDIGYFVECDLGYHHTYTRLTTPILSHLSIFELTKTR